MFIIIYIIKYEIRIAGIFYIPYQLSNKRCGVAVGESFGPASRVLGVRIQATTNLSRKNK